MFFLSSVGDVAVNLAHRLSNDLAPVQYATATLLNLCGNTCPVTRPAGTNSSRRRKKRPTPSRDDEEHERVTESLESTLNFARSIRRSRGRLREHAP